MGKKKTDGKINNEWYTPSWLIAEIRSFLGSIDLDVCSCDKANKIVNATRYFTKENSALENEDWLGRDNFKPITAYMNPPYLPSSLITSLIERFIAEYYRGVIKEGIILTHNSVDTKWFKLLSDNGIIAFSQGRISFIHSETFKPRENPPSGYIITYLGDNPVKFREWVTNIGGSGIKGSFRGFIVPNS